MKWSMWQYSLITMSYPRAMTGCFPNKSIAIFILKIKHVYFLFVKAIVCKYWSWLACKKLSLQLIFLKPHPNSLAVRNSLNSNESEIHAKLPLWLFFWLTFYCRYPCTLLTHFINGGPSFLVLHYCFSLHHLVEIRVQNVIWSKLLVSISQVLAWGQKMLTLFGFHGVSWFGISVWKCWNLVI